MKRLIILFSLILFVAASSTIMGRSIYVAPQGSDQNDGSQGAPYRTISKAASEAIAADSVIIESGTYRERVSPANGGINPTRRIIYMAAPGAEVYLKGSEVVGNWVKEGDSNGIWKSVVDNSIFGDFNPFDIKLAGDWLQRGMQLHLGEVYLNEVALSEVSNFNELKKRDRSWVAKVADKITTIYANFDCDDPNKELVEINVRPTCFFPKTTGVSHITVRGLNISQAATQWSPPTAEQIGIIGPNWSKDWVIEECEISNSKCVGICMGKDRSSGQNMWTLYRRKWGFMKDGFTREIEAIFKAYDLGWSKENIGSHMIQNNIIHDCGQAGIVGHMGCAFSTIRHNEIYNINCNKDIFGAETAGIKLHAGIDAIIEDNIIINSSRGIWLDWQAQGTIVRGNTFADSHEMDLFIEVSHGPTLVYNNILLSKVNLWMNAQGILIANNLLAGNQFLGKSQDRYTPYHVAHSTKIRGLFNNTGGDLRLYNNLLLGNGGEHRNAKNGFCAFNELPIYADSMSNHLPYTKFYLEFRFPVWSGGNVFYNGAKPYDKEVDYSEFEECKPQLKLEKRVDGYYLNGNLAFDKLKEAREKCYSINTDMLGQTFISELFFTYPDGSNFVLNVDLYGDPRDVDKPLAGPFENDSKRPIWRR